MKVEVKEPHRIVYETVTHQVIFEIDGVEYIVRQKEDNSGADTFVYSENLNEGRWMDPYDLEDGELKDILINLANTVCHYYLYEDTGEIDMNQLDEYL
jgi:hypothetical protein